MVEQTLPAENDIAWFSNGTSAKIMDGAPWGTNENGEPITKLVIRPTEIFIALNDVNRKVELINGRDLVVEIPSKFIIPLNPYSQSNSVFLIMCDYKRRHTDLTRYFYCHRCDSEYPSVFDSLRIAESTIKSKDIQIAQLRGELKETSEKIELKLSKENEDRIVDEVSRRIIKYLSGSRSERLEYEERE